MVDKPSGVLEFIGTQLLFRSIVHLRIIELEFCFAGFDALAVGELDPIPVRLILGIGF
jgi:hypothetical protein